MGERGEAASHAKCALAHSHTDALPPSHCARCTALRIWPAPRPSSRVSSCRPLETVGHQILRPLRALARQPLACLPATIFVRRTLKSSEACGHFPSRPHPHAQTHARHLLLELKDSTPPPAGTRSRAMGASLDPRRGKGA